MRQVVVACVDREIPEQGGWQAILGLCPVVHLCRLLHSSQGMGGSGFTALKVAMVVQQQLLSIYLELNVHLLRIIKSCFDPFALDE